MGVSMVFSFRGRKDRGILKMLYQIIRRTVILFGLGLFLNNGNNLCVCVYVYVCTCTCTCMYMFMYMHVCAHTRVCVHEHVCSMCVHGCSCVCVHIHICVYTDSSFVFISYNN